MEEKDENVVEETTQQTNEQVEETPQVDESKFESAEDDDVIKVDLNKPPKPEENETKEDNADDSGVVAESENADAPQEQKEVMALEYQYNMQLNGFEVDGVKDREKQKEDRKDERTKIQASQQSEMIEQRNSGKPPKNFESAGNDILGGGFDLGAFEPS